jgi:predicted ATPase
VLTRLEVDGFKNLHGVEVEFGPFTCIAGSNGIGKSNLFDAIRFLSLLAEHRILDAARMVRGGDEDPTNPADLFPHGTLDDAPEMRLAAEMLVPLEVEDVFGQRAGPSISFLRYEIRLRYQRPEGADRFGRLELSHESLEHINQGEAREHLHWPHSAGAFRRAVVVGVRRGGAFISTDDVDGASIVKVHQDGGSRGRPRPAQTATATVVGATTTVDDPTIFAAKREMMGWKLLTLEPSAMRRPDRYWEAGEATSVAENGAHISGALWQLANDPESRAEVCAHVTGLLSDLLPVADLRIVPNDARQQYELELKEPRGAWMGARALSEGTLRFLALATLSVDPASARLVCMEEPENGIHPARIPAIIGLLDHIAVDPQKPPGEDNPVRQVIINTHSPRLVQELERQGRSADLLVAESATVRIAGRVHRTVRFRYLKDTWRERDGRGGVGLSVALDYLTVPPEAQARLALADG